MWPPNFWTTTLFSGFSHNTDRKVPSEVVLKALCHYIVPSVTKNSKSAILRAPQNGGKSLTSAHELVYAIAYSLVGISVIVNKQRVD